MKWFNRNAVIALVTAGLFCGSAARAVEPDEAVQTEPVLYSVTLIDVDKVGTEGTSGLPSVAGTTPVPGTTKKVQVKVTVSIPRTGAKYSVPIRAVPARLMARPHSGDTTAFDGSITLTQDAPYTGNNEGTPVAYRFYPMPQKTAVPNMTAIASGTAESTYADYVTAGLTHDPARWEATYVSEVYTLDEATGNWPNALVDSIMKNNTSYEWYVAARYGLSSATRVSDIQDHGRKMTFLDKGLWEAVPLEEMEEDDGALITEFADELLLGKTFKWRLKTLGGDGKVDALGNTNGWRIYRAAIGTSGLGQPGLQFLNVKGTHPTYNDFPRVESPVYPNGIQSVSFEACYKPGLDEGYVQKLLVQVLVDEGEQVWMDVGSVSLSATLKTYTVEFENMAPGSKNPRFRLVRPDALASGGQMTELVVTVRNLLVRSEAPGATVGMPTIRSTGSANLPNQHEDFQIEFPLKKAVTGSEPRKYEPTLKLRRRAANDTDAAWYEAAPGNVPPGAGVATFNFTPGVAFTNADCSTNAVEGAFFQNTQKKVSGVLPGVYDLMLSCDILGSYEAGREIIEQREKVSIDVTSYETALLDENEKVVTDETGKEITVTKPYLLDVREQQTLHREVFARVQYRTGTADKSAPYQLKTVDIPFLPSSSTANLWRADLSRRLRLPDDDSEVYAWGYDPTPEGETGDEVFVTDVLSFTLYARQGNTTSIYGRAGDPSVMPMAIEAEPAVTETLTQQTTTAPVTPLVVTLEGLPNSHVALEANLETEDAPVLRIGGSYWQDFNTWYAPSMNFSMTEFRENVTSATADFNCTVDANGNRLSGWVPDEGPLSATTSFKDTFEVYHGEPTDSAASGRPIITRGDSEIANNRFASWGASHEEARPSYLNMLEPSDGASTEYVKLPAGAEVVLTRDWTVSSGGEYRPDAQIRLRGTSEAINPLSGDDAQIVLRGVGRVSFTVGRSIPYNVSTIANLTEPGSAFRVSGYGFSAGVQLESPSTTCAASGYSVSYILMDEDSGVNYELRLTQILTYGTNKEQAPTPSVAAELYKWTGDTAQRLTIRYGNQDKAYHLLSGSLNGSAFGLRIDENGYIQVGYASGLTSVVSGQFATKEAVAPTGNNEYGIAVNSAECLPTFRNLCRLNQNNFQNPTAIPALRVASSFGTKSPWTVSKDNNATQLRRIAPDANTGAVIVSTTGAGTPIEHFITVVKTGETFDKELGATNATLRIAPANASAAVFIDNLSVTSWSGDDTLRNGTYVPSATDPGFSDQTGTGFAGVGVWIKPKETRDLTVAASQYSGEQILLMQRSRKNMSLEQQGDQTGEDENGETTLPDGTTRHTGNRLALYSPPSKQGFGAVSFRYRIPTQNEFNGKLMPPVKVMLQHTVSSSPNYFTAPIPEGQWTNVSEPVELQKTGDEWSVASITPRTNGGKGNELVGTTGALRLVMVTTELDATDDPYVYIDDFTVTNNNEGTLASWTAQNVKLTESPISQLYWKDREAGEVAEGYAEEKLFAEKSRLTRAIQFNDVTQGSDVDGTFDVSELISPELLVGAGRVTFSARLADGETNPTRLYLYADEDDNKGWRPLWFAEIKNGIYERFELDLSKQATYLKTGDRLDCTKIRRLQFRTLLQDDGNTQDANGDSDLQYARVLVDQIVIDDPIRPSLRVAEVAFSNIAGNSTPDQFDRSSPLSQPVAKAPILRAMVTLDQDQLLDKASIRVFLTLDPHAPGSTTAGDNLLSSTDTSFSAYTDVLNNKIYCSTASPVYYWNPANAGTWARDKWFDMKTVEDALAEHGGEAFYEKLPAELQAATFELFPNADGDMLFYGEDLTTKAFKGKKLTEFEANSIVRYNVWVVYKTEDPNLDAWYVSQMEAKHYTDLPWYFPRSVNRDVQNVLAGENGTRDPSVFSPYYWVYSTTPGEVFVNEINTAEATDATPSTNSFYEICAPAGVNLMGWRLGETLQTNTEIASTINIGTGVDVVLPQPSAGAVPTRRTINTFSNRAFYTIFGDRASDLYYDLNGTRYDRTSASGTSPETKTATNAGMAQKGLGFAMQSGSYARSVVLYRPTGGAEHIVVHTSATENNAPNAATNVDTLYNAYKKAYAEQGFGQEWKQTFVDANWETEEFGPVGALAEDTLPDLHARRLVKIDTYPTAGSSTDDRYDPAEKTSTTYASDISDTMVGSTKTVSSFATVDMGGFWVMRKNAIVTDAQHGPADLSILMAETWDSSINPVTSPRGQEVADVQAASGAPTPYVQVTPRQINPDQYLLPYTGLEQSLVNSTLESGLGTHALTLLQSLDGTTWTPVTTMNAGRNTPNSWSVPKEYRKATLTYTALPFHTLTSVSIRMELAKDRSRIADPTTLIEAPTTGTASAPDAEGWVTWTFNDAAAADFILTMSDADDANVRYNVEAKATFELIPGLATGIINKVGTYCGSTLPAQPWWGSSFGFEVGFETDAEKLQGATLSSVFVTYPSPQALKTLTWGTASLTDAWTGVPAGLEGKDPETARKLLEENGLRFVELTSADNGFFRDATVMGILGDEYATAMGYDPDDATTYASKEPAIPFCVWGVYSFTVQSDRGKERVSFLLRQDDLGTTASFTLPTWYQPLEPLSTAVPYFYLYSTPPEAAWLSEVNLVAGPTGSAPYAEVVLPELREGITKAGVPQTTVQGWKVRTYAEDGTEGTDTTLDSTPTYASASYRYYLANIAGGDVGRIAYTLIRPCGAAEGGVWTGVSDNGDDDVTLPTLTKNEWLADPTNYYVVPGKTDARNVDGSVQLVGETETYLDTTIKMISSSIAKRKVWDFLPETPAANNNGITPDIVPTWNRVTVISTMRNTVYGLTLCGFQTFGFFADATAAGTASTEGAITLSLAGQDWVYSETNPRVISYRPRSNYRFEQLSLPKDLIGKVMLIGADQALTPAEVEAAVTELKALAETKPSACYEEWIAMGRDGTGATRATAQYHYIQDETGKPQVDYTGVITFNPDFLESPIGAEETVTFGDLDTFVVTLVFVEEPPSAENPIEMAMGQGEVKNGAWLTTQTLYAIARTDAGDPLSEAPVAEKGGIAVTKPIWSDEDGNADGDYKDQHGWLYQPVTGDSIGMAAVINPELGLLNGRFAGGTLESVRDALEDAKKDSGTIRPMLVWTLIDKTKVPNDLFATAPTSTQYTAFMDNWDLAKWIGGTPSIGDNLTVNLQTLRQRLLNNAGSTGSIYAEAGILPMVYIGYCTKDDKTLGDPDAADPIERATETLLAFRTMNAAELAAVKANPAATQLYDGEGLIPYSSSIEMTGANWMEGGILRFAIILVDTATNTIYDCQSISNFSSENVDAYCPWYLPDATTNVNALTKRRERGISPYAWVYTIPEGTVWLNEVRPFADESAKAASALELAMLASPLDDKGAPTYSLDGWHVVTKVAILPHATAALENQIAWTELQRVPLRSWVPYRRIDPDYDTTTGNPNYYDLDYYGMTTSAETDFGSNGDSLFDSLYLPVDETVTGGTGIDAFCWLKLARELFGAEDAEAIKEVIETDPSTVPYAALPAGASYTEHDLVYAVALERTNGVVVDEFLFYRSNAASSNYDAALLRKMERMNRAIAMENAHDCVVNEVRGLTVGPVPSAPRTIQFLRNVDQEILLWTHASESGSEAQLITLVGMNFLRTLVQPRLTISDAYLPAAKFFLSAQVVGGPGDVTATQASETVGPKPSITANWMRGTEYRLLLSGTNDAWFDLTSATKNGTVFTPTLTEETTYATTGGTTLATSVARLVDAAKLEKNTDYVLNFVLSTAAKELDDAGGLITDDEDFLDWVMQVDPDDIGEDDPLTPAEKYWLGFENAAEDLPVALTFTQVGSHIDQEGAEPMPLLAISFTKDGTEVTELTGDGRLVLLGKEKLDDEWSFVQYLTSGDINGDNVLILATKHKFFKAVLISFEAAEAMR